MSKPVDIDETIFEEAVIKAKTPVLVDFWAARCAPCLLIEPIIDQLANEYAGKVSFYKINRDENFKVANRYNVMSIPTVMVFKGGKPVFSAAGFTKETKRQIKESIDSVI
jgi:thioredoxin 1